MATPKKKHLIELMIEAGVKWPDGAEYAAQDKKNMRVNFYRNGKPNMLKGEDEWLFHYCDFMWSYGVVLPFLCRNWHQTIVTREQYAEAVAAGNGEHEQQPLSGVSGSMPSETIESLLAEIKAKREEHEALVAKTESLALEIVGIELQVNDKLKEYGFVMSPVAALSVPEQPVITDWRDLRVGDVVECVLVCGENGAETYESDNEFHGLTCNVIGFTEHGKNHIKTDLKPSGHYIQEFKFVRRP